MIDQQMQHIENYNNFYYIDDVYAM